MDYQNETKYTRFYGFVSTASNVFMNIHLKL